MRIPAPPARDQGMAISGDGTRIAWDRYGAGEPTIVFIPTWNLVDARVVGHQVASLATRATVVTYDPRGHGASDRPAAGYTFDLHAADALAVMRGTEVEQAAIVVASRGLNAAVILATEHPSAVERIAAIAPYMQLQPDPAPPDPADLEGLRTDWSGFIDPFMHLVFTEPESEEVIEQMIGIGMEASPDVIAQQETELEWTRPARLLPEVACPVLVIHGEADAAVPASLAREISDLLPDAVLWLIPGAGHRPDIRSPELVNPRLHEFLLGSADRA